MRNIISYVKYWYLKGFFFFIELIKTLITQSSIYMYIIQFLDKIHQLIYQTTYNTCGYVDFEESQVRVNNNQVPLPGQPHPQGSPTGRLVVKPSCQSKSHLKQVSVSTDKRSILLHEINIFIVPVYIRCMYNEFEHKFQQLNRFFYGYVKKFCFKDNNNPTLGTFGDLKS